MTADAAEASAQAPRAVVRGMAAWLSLAAAPTFAMMALLTAGSDAGRVLCRAPAGGALGGMVLMYLLMSAFHLPPWLKLLAEARGAPRSLVARRPPMIPGDGAV